ncbi:Protein kinase, partial [Aphelenchoides avenae]
MKHHLTDHVARIHEKRSRFRCKECGKSFHLRTDLVRHSLTHLERQKFKCDECESQFLNKRNLVLHVTSIHRNAPLRKDHKCDFCGYATADKNRLDQHVTARHKKERPLQCTECSQSFAWKVNLQRHLQLHGTQTFKCTKCGRQYRREDSLRTHLAIHGEKMQCDFCIYATPQMKDLKKHVLRRHKDELRQTIVAAHSEAPCCTPGGEVTASKGDVWVKYQPAPGVIGQGDFGNVFKAKLRSAEGTMHGYRYAIKSVDLTTTNELQSEDHLRKCRREVQLMHDCHHENVMPIYEFFEFYYENEPNNFCMVMELGSESLTSVKDDNHLTEEQCLFILVNVAAALKHVHSRGIVHRDVKPDNVVICVDGEPKLCDFGESARLREDDT